MSIHHRKLRGCVQAVCTRQRCTCRQWQVLHDFAATEKRGTTRSRREEMGTKDDRSMVSYKAGAGNPHAFSSSLASPAAAGAASFAASSAAGASLASGSCAAGFSWAASAGASAATAGAAAASPSAAGAAASGAAAAFDSANCVWQHAEQSHQRDDDKIGVTQPECSGQSRMPV